MTINVAAERSTLTLPGARLRAEARAEARAGSGPGVREQQGGRAAPITIARAAPEGLSELRAVVTGLDRASSVADVAMAAADAIAGLLQQLRGEAASARDGRGGAAFAGLTGRIGDQVRGATFDGANLLDGSMSGGALRLSPDGDGAGDVSLTARDMRPGGGVVTVSADQDPATALPDVEASLANVQAARDELRGEFTRLEAHRSFVGALSKALAGEPAVDLDAEGARLTALQLRQALGEQTLSISNAAPQAVLSLFR